LTSPAGVKQNSINPSASSPERAGLRFTLNWYTLGKLERLAQSRFTISKLTDEDLGIWKEHEAYWELAQSVNASSAIEGEGVHANSIPVILAAVTQQNTAGKNAELQGRERAVRDIYEACIWALRTRMQDFLNFDFVLELHHRMFKNSKPEAAGKLKHKTVVIRGAGYYIETLPQEKTEEYLRALCDRTNRDLLQASEHATKSMFLCAAEFINDFLAIHPFGDGNGRTARVLSTYLLERCGYRFARFYSLDTIILENKANYYEALFESQCRWYESGEDITPWIEFYTDSVFKQWQRAYQNVLDRAERRGR
jgi:Fic family protein